MSSGNGFWQAFDAWGHRIIWIIGLLATMTAGAVGYAMVSERSYRNEERLDKVENTLDNLDRKMTRVLVILEQRDEP